MFARAKKFVNFMRKSTPAAEEMRRLQRQQIERQNEGINMDDVEEDSREESEGEEPGYDLRRHEGKLKRVLAFRQEVETRWNSLYYMVERLLAMQPACEQWCRDHAMHEVQLEVTTFASCFVLVLFCASMRTMQSKTKCLKSLRWR